jgi:hypothetical protein
MNRSALTLSLLTLFGWHHAAQADELGRLFFTPEQRQQLDYQKTTGNVANVESPRRNVIVVNGVVQKKGGNRTVWINGTAQPAERSDSKNPAVAPVIIPGKSRPVQLKVGEPLLLQAPAPAPAPAPENDD